MQRIRKGDEVIVISGRDKVPRSYPRRYSSPRYA